MADVPIQGDLIVRSVLRGNDPAAYSLVEAVSYRVLVGPFADVARVARSALALAAERHVTLWQEQLDDRGRALGHVQRLLSADEPSSTPSRVDSVVRSGAAARQNRCPTHGTFLTEEVREIRTPASIEDLPNRRRTWRCHERDCGYREPGRVPCPRHPAVSLRVEAVLEGDDNWFYRMSCPVDEARSLFNENRGALLPEDVDAFEFLDERWRRREDSEALPEWRAIDHE